MMKVTVKATQAMLHLIRTSLLLRLLWIYDVTKMIIQEGTESDLMTMTSRCPLLTVPALVTPWAMPRD